MESCVLGEDWIFSFPFPFLFLFPFRRSLWILPFMLSETGINMASRACRRDGRSCSFLFFAWTFCVVLGDYVLIGYSLLPLRLMRRMLKVRLRDMIDETLILILFFQERLF